MLVQVHQIGSKSQKTAELLAKCYETQNFNTVKLAVFAFGIKHEYCF